MSRQLIPTLAFVLILVATDSESRASPNPSQDKPTVVSTNPADGATGVSRHIESFSITFSKPMEIGSCGAITSNWGKGSCSWSADKLTMTINRGDEPAPLALGIIVKVFLNPSGHSPWIKDAEGNFLDPFQFSFTTEQGNAETIKVPADVGSGFHWPYYLYIPNTTKVPTILLVESNNTGRTSDDQSVHDDAAAQKVNAYKRRAEDLGSPFLVPVFPRPSSNWHIYTHSLDRDSLTTDLPKLVRIDLQLIAMIDDASDRLASRGISVEPKVWMIGFSASASFAIRFTVLHPERVMATSAGSGGSYPIAPVPEWKGKSLPYPVGVADLEQLVGREFDLQDFQSVPVQIYIGDQDLDDALNYSDGYDPQEAALIKEVFGGPPPFMRWPAVEAAYNSIQSPCQFVIFPGMDHRWPEWSFIKGFFENFRAQPFPPPPPKPKLYKIYFPHVASFGGWETEIGITNTSEVTVEGYLNAHRKEGGEPFESLPINLPPLGREEITVGASGFQSPHEIDYLVFVSDSGFVAGYTRFFQPGNRVTLAAMGGSKTGWFTKMERDGWTGIAFVNTECTGATVSLTAWDASGNQVDSTTVNLTPGQKWVGLVHQLFTADITTARYFKFTSDKSVLGFTASGSSDNLILDGLHSLGQYIPQ